MNNTERKIKQIRDLLSTQSYCNVTYELCNPDVELTTEEYVEVIKYFRAAGYKIKETAMNNPSYKGVYSKTFKEIQYNYNLFLDDFRSLEETYRDCLRDVRYLRDQWVITRSHNQFCAKIEELFALGKFPKTVTFDHDLTDAHYETIGMSALELMQYYTYEQKELTGWHSAKWMIEFVNKHKLNMPEVLIHTRNTGGKENINNLFISYYK